MTPQERQLVAELFDRLASLEGEPRDPEAERAIREGLARAPNAVYALVQTVLVQDEALKRANARIEELEQALSGEPPREAGFLDTVRNAMFGEPPRGSVPTVRPGDPDRGARVWGERYAGGQPMGAPPVQGQGYQGQGYQGQAQGYPGQAPGYGQGGFGGGSFLGTAAASAAGVIGGAMLLNSMRGMFGQQHGGQSAFDSPSGGGRTPWDSASKSDLARDAGLDDIGGKRTAAYDDDTRSAGLFGGSDDQDAGLDDDIAGDFGGDDGSDTA